MDSVPRSLYWRMRPARSVCRLSYEFASYAVSDSLRLCAKAAKQPRVAGQIIVFRLIRPARMGR